PTPCLYPVSTVSRSFLLFQIPPPPPASTLFPYTTLFRSLCKLLLRHTTHLTKRSYCNAELDESISILKFNLFTHLQSPTFFLLRSEEHTSELQSRFDLVCRLLLEKKKNIRCQRSLPRPLP